jgi:hypothetical protein
VTVPDGDEQADRIKTLVNATSALLMRCGLGKVQSGDADTGRSLARSLQDVEAPAEILAVAMGGVWAAFRPPGEIDAETSENIADVARSFLTTGGYDGLLALSSASLTLMARRGMTSSRGADLALAARVAWELEHHDLASVAGREALACLDLDAADRALVEDILLRTTRSVSSDRTTQAPTSQDHVSMIAQVQPLQKVTGDVWGAARDAVIAGDRISAAQHMSRAVRELRELSRRDHEFLDGLGSAFTAMSEEPIDVVALRRGLVVVVRQLRRRQRFGSVPPAVRSALELVVLVLTSAHSEATGSVLSELLEALADAGLSEVTLDPGSASSSAEVEARLAEEAVEFDLWPDLAECVEGLQNNFGLLSRRVGGGVSSAERWVTMFIVPPDGVLIKSGPIPAMHAQIMQGLAAGDQGVITATTRRDIEAILGSFVHSEGLDRLRREPPRGLVIVPDGDQWSVPWQAAPSLSSRPTTLAPSLTVYNRLRQFDGRIRTVTALIDDTVEGADELIDELITARNLGHLEVDFSPAGIARAADLFLVLGHGSGEGLRFRVGLPHDSLDALQIARQFRSRTALVASCWSAKSPPVTMPLNLPVSLLLRGASISLGGAWQLPQRETAEMLCHVVRELVAGATLPTAISNSRGTVSSISGWGLIATGRLPAWTGEAQ